MLQRRRDSCLASLILMRTTSGSHVHSYMAAPPQGYRSLEHPLPPYRLQVDIYESAVIVPWRMRVPLPGTPRFWHPFASRSEPVCWLG